MAHSYRALPFLKITTNNLIPSLLWPTSSTTTITNYLPTPRLEITTNNIYGEEACYTYLIPSILSTCQHQLSVLLCILALILFTLQWSLSSTEHFLSFSNTLLFIFFFFFLIIFVKIKVTRTHHNKMKSIDTGHKQKCIHPFHSSLFKSSS